MNLVTLAAPRGLPAAAGGLALLAACAVSVVCAPSAQADVITIDDTTPGSVYNGILDGFPLPPPGTAPDGNGDSLAGSLGVALQSGVTEERGIVELPLSPLAGVIAEDIESATLTFNIDDVVGTFGPGTTFDGTAAESIVVWSYAGNGTVDLTDFGNVSGPPLSVVSTTSHGVITDSSLAVSGPLSFEIDVTAALITRLNASATFFGFVLATQDNPTGTSLDNLGNSGSGPPGVGGSFLPYLTVVTAATEPPVLGKDDLVCQKAIAKAAGKHHGVVYSALAKCMNGVLAAAAKGSTLDAVTAKCAAALDADSATSAVGKSAAKTASAITAACEGTSTSDLGDPCDEDATTFAQVAECIVERENLRAQQSAADAFGMACLLLENVNQTDDYPAVCD